MKFKRVTFLFIFLAVLSSIMVGNWMKQGLLGLGVAVLFLMIAAFTTKTKGN
ncbi:hypothetical protein [Bacillus sp. 1P06AnD]|uniref:hypothetical protein n=1 Tax=Bacillus sp. 1P06AnD TaxID=3132208 RepID=UPI0039A15269